MLQLELNLRDLGSMIYSQEQVDPKKRSAGQSISDSHGGFLYLRHLSKALSVLLKYKHEIGNLKDKK